MVSRSGDGSRNVGTGGKNFYGVVAGLFVLISLLGSSQGRPFQQAGTSHNRILRAYTDNTKTAMHGPSVKSFLVSDGSWVDCVRVEEQIAAHHPDLKDHVIQMVPSSNLQEEAGPRDTRMHPQNFAREHGGCPEGTIPVQRRNSTQPLLKKNQSPKTMNIESIEAATDSSIGPHQYAIVEAVPTGTGIYGGSGAHFSVNGPTIEDTSLEFSLSQLWVGAGSYNDSSINTAEVGWQVYPSIHANDSPLAPHLFIYWTADAYKTTGCYNLGCAGFVQTSSTIVLGGTMANYTTLAENLSYEFDFAISVIYVSADAKWWLYVDGEVVGYWPSSLYNTMKTGADFLQWGGEIAPATSDPGHTTTQMGSGAFPSESYPEAAFQRNVTYSDTSGNTYNVVELQTIVTNENCYNSTIDGNIVNWGTYFFFGGPGGANAACV